MALQIVPVIPFTHQHVEYRKIEWLDDSIHVQFISHDYFLTTHPKFDSIIMLIEVAFMAEHPDQLGRWQQVFSRQSVQVSAVVFNAFQATPTFNLVAQLQKAGIEIRGITTTAQSDTLSRALYVAIQGGYLMDVVAWEWEYFSRFSKMLSRQEYTFLQSLISGETSKTIADRISRSHRTVEAMREKIYAKFGVRTRKELLQKLYPVVMN